MAFLKRAANKIEPFLFFVAVSAYFPLQWLVPLPAYSSTLVCATNGVLAALAFGALCLRPGPLCSMASGRPLLFSLCALFSLLCVVQFLVFETYRLADLFQSLFWVAVPLLVYCRGRRWWWAFLNWLAVFWCLNLVQSWIQYKSGGEFAGVIGNRNWHAAFLLAAAPFIVIFVVKSWGIILMRWAGRSSFQGQARLLWVVLWRVPICIGAVLGLLAAPYMVYICESRGAWLAVCAAVVVIAAWWAESFKSERPGLARAVRLVPAMAVALACVALLGAYLFAKDSLYAVVREDVRIPLWEGTVNMYSEHKAIGVGESGFEAALAPYRPREYFERDNSAVRSNHPHNALLYAFSCFGLCGGLLWTLLWCVPVLGIILLKNSREASLMSKAVCFGFVVLLIHGMLDLILFEWPTVVFAAILLGFLWRELWPTVDAVVRPRDAVFLWTTRAAGVGAVLFGLQLGADEFESSYHHRSARYYEDRRNFSMAMMEYDETLKRAVRPQYIYKAALCALIRHENPTLAMEYFKLFDTIPCSDFAHYHGFKALTLRGLGRLPEALEASRAECRNYPTLVGTWYNHHLLCKALGKTDEAAAAYASMSLEFQKKGLPSGAMELLLKNPDFDMHPSRIPKAELDSMRKVEAGR